MTQLEAPASERQVARLRRSKAERVIAGVCGGLGRYFGVDPVWFRLAFIILAIGPLTGASVNPARALGPAFASGQWTAQAVYWIGPIIGGILAALVWEFLLIGREKVAES